jgi:hypothetical protein
MISGVTQAKRPIPVVTQSLHYRIDKVHNELTTNGCFETSATVGVTHFFHLHRYHNCMRVASAVGRSQILQLYGDMCPLVTINS